MSQGPSCVLTHPADLHQLVGQSCRCAQPSHMEDTQRNQKVNYASQELPYRGQFPSNFFPGYQHAAHFAPHNENCICTRKQLLGVGLRTFWRSSDISAQAAIIITIINIALCILQRFCWDWETQACLSLRSDETKAVHSKQSGCSCKTPHLHTFFWNEMWLDTIHFIPLDSLVALAYKAD